MKALSNSAECPNCGSGHKSKPFCLYENGWYCFSCGYRKVADRLNTFATKENKVVQIPEGCTNNISKFSYEALLWLAERNVTEKDIIKNNIFYKADTNSLVFVSLDKNNNPVHIVQRNLTERGFFIKGTKSSTLLTSKNNENILVLVEDYISCIRVSYSFDCLCLWGTSINYQELMKWFNKYDVILVWLDNDKQKQTNSGQIAAEKIINMAKYCIMRWDRKRFINPKKINNIVTDKEPRDYLDSEIRRIVNDTRTTCL